MNAVTCAENELLHFWVPVTSLVTEVYARCQHIAH
ncbi:Uncharacterised protein [Vibrio cholerae]|nr:Uncharacterised protein [Vibrio cholerae]